MPYLLIRTNVTVSTAVALLTEASHLVSTLLGKPEEYVQVSLQGETPMLFSGTDDPTAYIELKSLGFPQAKAEAVSAALCDLLEKWLSVPPERVYLAFSDHPGEMWGWNRSTF